VLLAGAFGGGYYVDLRKRQSVEKQLAETKQKAALAEDKAIATLAASRARTQLLEATLGVVYGNYGMAFDRVIRTLALGRRMGLLLDNEVQEITALLTDQKPEAATKILTLADRIEPAAPLTLPKTPQQPAASGSGAAAATTPAAKTPTPTPTPPLAKPTPPPPPAALPVPKAERDSDSEHDFKEGREALRQAKELLLIGGDSHELVKRIGRAQVLLNESGYTDADDDLAAAIKAAKGHEEARTRAALEAALSKLRTR
jgi:hypothetical protein